MLDFWLWVVTSNSTLAWWPAAYGPPRLVRSYESEQLFLARVQAKQRHWTPRPSRLRISLARPILAR